MANIKWKYGVTEDQYDVAILESFGRCAICNKIPRLGLDLDHCHKTMKFRGLLCRDCNSKIGKLDQHWEEVLTYLRTRG